MSKCLFHKEPKRFCEVCVSATVDNARIEALKEVRDKFAQLYEEKWHTTRQDVEVMIDTMIQKESSDAE